MKPRISGLFIECYRGHKTKSKAKLDELLHLLLTLFKYCYFPAGTEIIFQACASSSRGTFISFTLEPNMKGEIIVVSLDDSQTIIDEVIRLATDIETVRLFRKKKLELEICV